MVTITRPTTEPLRWYAVYVRSHYENVVQESLAGKGYCAFSPCYRMRRKGPDRTTEVIRPLFPGYVFGQFDPSLRLPVLTTPGVVKIVGSRNGPEPIDDAEILSIQAIVKSDRPIQPWPFLRVGQRVEVTAGPLSGVVGTLLKVKDEYRLIASITLLQRSIAVEIDRDSVKPVSQDRV
jgi:transcription antitermination factor NusG